MKYSGFFELQSLFSHENAESPCETKFFLRVCTIIVIILLDTSVVSMLSIYLVNKWKSMDSLNLYLRREQQETHKEMHCGENTNIEIEVRKHNSANKMLLS